MPSLLWLRWTEDGPREVVVMRASRKSVLCVDLAAFEKVGFALDFFSGLTGDSEGHLVEISLDGTSSTPLAPEAVCHGVRWADRAPLLVRHECWRYGCVFAEA